MLITLGRTQNAAKKALEKGLADSPVILTSSPAAVKFVKSNFPQLAASMLVYNSAQREFGEYVKTAFAADKKLDANNIRTISITADNENAAEAAETRSVDFSINARELYRIFMRTGCNLAKLRPVELDSIGDAEVKYDGLFAPVKWEVSGQSDILTVTATGKPIQAAIAKNLGQARALLTELATGLSTYKIIRIIA